MDENMNNHMAVKYSHMLKSLFNQSRKGAWIVFMCELDTTVPDLIFESLKFGNNLSKRYLHTAGFYVTPRSIINYLGWDQVGWSDWVRAYSLITHYPYLEEVEPSPHEIDHVCKMAGVFPRSESDWLAVLHRFYCEKIDRARIKNKQTFDNLSLN